MIRKLLLALAGLLVLGLVYLGYSYQAPDMARYDQPKARLVMAASQVSQQHQAVVRKLEKYNADARLWRGVEDNRRALEALFFQEVEAEILPVTADGIPSEWVLAPGADPNRRLLYLHGGSFRVGSPRSHRFIASELSRRAGLAVLVTDYRLQPEHKIIHCHEDARKAYRWILQQGPRGAGPLEALFVAGDSAGGNLALAVIAWARNEGLRPANGAIAFAPLTDFTLSSPSWRTNLETDPFLGPGMAWLAPMPRLLIAIAMRFSAGLPTNDPQISPLLGPLDNLPPTLIQVSQAELLYDDSQRYANRATAEGSQVTLQVWPKLAHVFQAFPELPEAQDALAKAADFIRSQSPPPHTTAHPDNSPP